MDQAEQKWLAKWLHTPLPSRYTAECPPIPSFFPTKSMYQDTPMTPSTHTHGRFGDADLLGTFKVEYKLGYRSDNGYTWSESTVFSHLSMEEARKAKQQMLSALDFSSISVVMGEHSTFSTKDLRKMEVTISEYVERPVTSCQEGKCTEIALVPIG